MSQVEIFSPYDLQTIKSLPLLDAAGAEQALATAEKMERQGPLPKYQRVAILEKTLEILRPQREALAKAAALEGGKPLQDSFVEVDRGFQGIQNAIEVLGHLGGKEIPMGHTVSSQGRWAFTTREPIGTVVAVSAFNHPFNLIIHQVIPAIATGCPVIIKPSTMTPISCLNIAEALYEAGLDKEWCQVALSETEVAEKLVTDPRVRFFSFIGSAKVGWYLRSKLAPGTRCALEHGGAAPVIIDQSADVSQLLPLIAKGGFYHSGQVCVSVQRVFVHESRMEEVSQGLATLAGKMVVGDPTLAETEAGPLIRPRENDRVAQWVEESKKEGARVLSGGEKISETCYQPTVLVNPSAESKVSNSEIFGPVVCLYSYSSLDEAIGRANNVPFSFQASVFSQDLDVAMKCAKKMSAAAVMINDHTAFRVDWMPFAGHRTSGLGVGGIPYTMEDMTEEKLIVIKSAEL